MIASLRFHAWSSLKYLMPRTSAQEISKTIKPYKILCNSLLKNREFRNPFTGSRAFLWDKDTASISENQFLNSFEQQVFEVEQASFPPFLSLHALVLAKGDNRDCEWTNVSLSLSHTQYIKSWKYYLDAKVLLGTLVTINCQKWAFSEPRFLSHGRLSTRI